MYSVSNQFIKGAETEVRDLNLKISISDKDGPKVVRIFALQEKSSTSLSAAGKAQYDNFLYFNWSH